MTFHKRILKTFLIFTFIFMIANPKCLPAKGWNPDTPAWVQSVSLLWITAIGVSWWYQHKKPEPVPVRSLEQIREAAIDTLRYLATPVELDSIRQMGDTVTIKTWVNAWWIHQYQDPVRSAALRDEYTRRFRVADSHYGWSTDRGRVYILYGPPEHIEHHPWGAVSPHPQFIPPKSFEYWIYDRASRG